ncbi:phospholipase B1, membrane-associated-like [Rhynchonycteris naso]
MGPQPHIFLLGLLLLLGQGTTQTHTFPREDTLEEQLWPESLRNFQFLCNPKKSESNLPSESVHSLRPSDIKFVAAIGHVDTSFQTSSDTSVALF